MQIEHNGRTQSATAWARELGISYHVLRWRLQHWSVERALTAPRRGNSKHLYHDGRTQNLRTWALEVGIAPRTLTNRLRRGETTDEALSYRRKQTVK